MKMNFNNVESTYLISERPGEKPRYFWLISYDYLNTQFSIKETAKAGIGLTKTITNNLHINDPEYYARNKERRLPLTICCDKLCMVYHTKDNFYTDILAHRIISAAGPLYKHSDPMILKNILDTSNNPTHDYNKIMCGIMDRYPVYASYIKGMLIHYEIHEIFTDPITITASTNVHDFSYIDSLLPRHLPHMKAFWRNYEVRRKHNPDVPREQCLLVASDGVTDQYVTYKELRQLVDDKQFNKFWAPDTDQDTMFRYSVKLTRNPGGNIIIDKCLSISDVKKAKEAREEPTIVQIHDEDLVFW